VGDDGSFAGPQDVSPAERSTEQPNSQDSPSWAMSPRSIDVVPAVRRDDCS
jgi:hypothetical protein